MRLPTTKSSIDSAIVACRGACCAADEAAPRLSAMSAAIAARDMFFIRAPSAKA